MFNAVTKSSLAAGYFKASTQLVTTSLKPLAVTFPSIEQSLTLPGTGEKLNNYSLTKSLPTGSLKISSGPGGNVFKITFNLYNLFLLKFILLCNRLFQCLRKRDMLIQI